VAAECSGRRRGPCRTGGPARLGPVYLLNDELYRSQWFAAEAVPRGDLATHQDALAAAGWTPIPFHP
jgi:hypothetical protein